MANVIPIDRVTAKSVNANNPNPTKLVRKEYLIAPPVAVKDKMSDVTWQAPSSSKDEAPDVSLQALSPSKAEVPDDRWQAPFLSEDGVSDSEWSPKDCRHRECQLKIE